MPRFMLVYKGEATDMSEMTPEQGAAVMAQWGVWMGKVGSGAAVVDDGSSGAAAAASGYSIVEANDMAGAKALTAGHPYLTDGKGAFAIDIFELMPVPDMS